MPSHWYCCVIGCQSNWRNWKKYYRTPIRPDIAIHYRIFYGSLIKWERPCQSSICSKHWSKPRKSFRDIPDIRIPAEYQCRQRKEVKSKDSMGLVCDTILNDLVLDQQKIAAFIENNCGKCLHEALEVDVAGHDYIEIVTIAKHKLYLALAGIPHMPTVNDPDESDSPVDVNLNERVDDIQKIGSGKGIVVKMEHINYAGDETADDHSNETVDDIQQSGSSEGVLANMEHINYAGDETVDDNSNETIDDIQQLGSSKWIVVKMEGINYAGDETVDGNSNEAVDDIQQFGSSEGIVVKMEHINYAGDEIEEADQHECCDREETDCGNIQSKYEIEERKSPIGERKADEAKVLQSLYRMQKAGEQCDFTIIARGKNNKFSVLKVHKVVLAAISDKIKLLKDDFMNAYNKLNVSDALRIIEFTYTRNINCMAELSDRDRRNLEDAATFLGVSLCVNYIRSFTNATSLSPTALDQFMAPTTPLSVKTDKCFHGSDTEVLHDIIEKELPVPALSKNERDRRISSSDAVPRTLNKEFNPSMSNPLILYGQSGAPCLLLWEAD